MKQLIAFACLGLLFASSVPAFAGVQQEKMKNCNKEAKEKGMKGDERKAFMKGCLGGKHEAAQEKMGDMREQHQEMRKEMKDAHEEMKDKQSGRGEKMKNCNKDAKEKALKGDERKKFMSGCLKG